MRPPALRLFHGDTNRHFIVAGGDVYADRDRIRRIRRSDRMLEPLDGVTREEVLAAAAYFTNLYELPVEGTASINRSIRSAGLLNRREIDQLENDPAGIPAVRTALERHLDFFDAESFDGRITLGENWRGWRRLGYGYLRSLIGTLGAAIIFGRIRDRLAIDIARIKDKRPQKSSGLYDVNGHVNDALLTEYLTAFREHASHGVITQAEAMAILGRKADLGSVSKRQFKSLFGLCTLLNRNEKVITERQFAGLFDGSLLYLAASIPGDDGRRRQLPSPAPRIIKLAVLLMTILFAPWGDNLWGVWRHGSGWLLVAASWLLYGLLSSRTAVERSVVLILGSLAAASVWSALSWSDSLAVWPFILLMAALAIGQQWRPVLQYIFYLRFPLLLALTTMALPVIGIWGAPLLFKTMFMLEWSGVMFVVMLAVLVGEVSLASARLIARHAERRFDAARWRGPAALIDRRHRWFAFLVALPIIVSLVWLSESSWAIASVSASTGVLLAFALGHLAARLGRRDTPRRTTIHRLVQERLDAIPGEKPGYADEVGRLLPGHLAHAGLFAVTMALYATGYFTLKPASPLQAPALAFVLFILIMLAWFLPAVSFFADKYKVSTLIALAVVPYVLYFILDIDHYYQMLPLPGAAASARTDASGPGRELRTAFEKRLARAQTVYPNTEPVMIAVAAGGGGGSAALWSARVLAGLQHQFGARFTDSIQMVSAVSGGSVGAMHFLNAFDQSAGPSDSRLDDAVQTAGRSTLSPIAWGLAYPDFWRLFSLRPFNPYVDRGWALEEALDAQLGRAQGVRLSQWRDDILAGWRPAVLFNATVSETGDRLVISPLRLRRVSTECREPDALRSASCEDQIDADTLASLYAANPDLRVATAARLSSTFPFVLPIPKPRHVANGERGYHLADGGYYDNDGLLTLVEWAQKAMTFAEPSRARKLLLIDIRLVDPQQEPRNRAGWIYTTIGPVLTMLRARGTSQVRRNLVDVKLLSDLRQAGEFTIQRVEFPLVLQTSRAWHLPASERDAIETYWNTDRAVLQARKAICDFLGPAEWTCASAAATGSP
jgi:patatin-like phospholipase/caleosin-related protein